MYIDVGDQRDALSPCTWQLLIMAVVVKDKGSYVHHLLMHILCCTQEQRWEDNRSITLERHVGSRQTSYGAFNYLC